MYCTFFLEPLHCCLKIRLPNLKRILAASSWFHHLKPNVDQHFHSPSARCRGSLCLGPQKISRFGLRRFALPSRELTYPTWAKGKSSSKVPEKKKGICDRALEGVTSKLEFSQGFGPAERSPEVGKTSTSGG